jgi:hypothetical protein
LLAGAQLPVAARREWGKTAGVPALLQQGMPLSAVAYSSVLQMREVHLLEIVLARYNIIPNTILKKTLDVLNIGSNTIL